MKIANSIYSNNINEDLQQQIYELGFKNNNHKLSENKEIVLKQRIEILSENKTFNHLEWELIGIEHSKNKSSCICGQSGIVNRYILKNVKNEYEISLGGSCLKKYFKIDEEIEIIKYLTSQEYYRWLGKKYDAYIYSILGFKNYYLYNKKREKKEKIDFKIDKIIEEGLKQNLKKFNSPYYHNRLQRAKRFHSFLKQKKIQKIYIKPKNENILLSFEKLTNEILNNELTNFNTLNNKDKNQFYKILNDRIKVLRKSKSNINDKLILQFLKIEKIIKKSLNFKSTKNKKRNQSKNQLKIIIEIIKENGKPDLYWSLDYSEQKQTIKELKRGIKNPNTNKNTKEIYLKVLELIYPQTAEFYQQYMK